MAYHWTVYSFGENSYPGNSEFDNFSLERSHTTFGLFLSISVLSFRYYRTQHCACSDQKGQKSGLAWTESPEIPPRLHLVDFRQECESNLKDKNKLKICHKPKNTKSQTTEEFVSLDQAGSSQMPHQKHKS